MQKALKLSKADRISARIMAHKGNNPTLFYTKSEEILNGVTHGLASIACVIGTIYLIAQCIANNNAVAFVICLIYGLSLILLYTMSTLYHSITNERAKKIMRVLDHSSIFLLIAGSYTPLTLIPIGHTFMGKLVCASVWAFAILGVILNAVNMHKFKKLSMLLYVGMGWAAILVFDDIINALSPNAFWLLLLGGVCYTGGLVFYSMKKVRYMHAVWHLFVIGGSVLHYICVAYYVLPMMFV